MLSAVVAGILLLLFLFTGCMVFAVLQMEAEETEEKDGSS